MQRFVSTLLIGTVLFVCAGGDWPEFRGPAHNPVVPDVSLPAKLADHLAWKIELPGRGASSPIVVRGRVVVTASSGPLQDRLHVLCFDAGKGKLLWHRQFWATGRTLCHSSSAVAANTPCSDGDAIYAFFSSNDLICLDLDGNLRWLRGLTYDHPTAANDVGLAASPVVAGPVVVVQVECQGESFVAGLDRNTGQTRWMLPRPRQANWSSPIAWTDPVTGNKQVVAQSGQMLTGIHPETGQVLWNLPLPCRTIPSCTPAGDGLLVPTGRGLVNLQLPGTARQKTLWTSNRLAPSDPSPLVWNDQVLVIKRTILAAGSLEDGKLLWQLRLRGQRFWATPVVGGTRLFAVSDDGLGQVVQLPQGRKGRGRILDRYEFEDRVLGSPALTSQGLFVRSLGALWKFSVGQP